MRPHAALIEETGARIAEPELHASLERGWTLAHDASAPSPVAAPLTPVTLLTPVTKLALPVVTRSGRTTVVKPITAVTVIAQGKEAAAHPPAGSEVGSVVALPASRRRRRHAALAAVMALAALGTIAWQIGDRFGLADLAQQWVQREGQVPTPQERGTADREPAPESRVAATEEPSAPRRHVEAAKSLPPTMAGSTTGAAPAPAASPPSPTAVAPGAPPSASAVERRLSQAAPAATASSAQDAGAKASETAPPSTEVAAEMAPSRVDVQTSSATAPKAVRTPALARGNSARPLAATPSIGARATSGRPSPPARRALPAWVSLEPPAWLRTGKPPNPPGMIPSKARASAVTAATDSSHEAVAAAVAGVSGRPDRGSAGASLAPLAVVADAPAPTAAGEISSAPADSRVAPPTPSKRLLFGAARAAPIEERSGANARPAQPVPAPIREAEPEPPPEDYAAQARRMLSETVPRLALRAEPEVARILWLASADDPMQDRFIADAARAVRIPDDGSLAGCPAAVVAARRRGDEARATAGSRRNAMEAFDRELRAFGANPRDPEIAGNLALLHLKLTPPQPDRARQLALFALTARCPQYASARIEDWNTFAVASALSGREADATRALFVTLALAGNGEARCVAALNALSSYGAPMRGPVEAMFYRMRSQGRGNYSPACAWPATFTARRLP